MNDCQGHRENQSRKHVDVTSAERGCKANVALTLEGQHHDAYFDGDLEIAIVDLLADLRHLCVVEALDYSAIDAKAQAHFDVEIRITKRDGK